MKLIIKQLALLFFFFAIGFGASAQKSVTTENGFRFVNHTNLPGAKAVPGDLVRLHMAVFLGDTMLMDSRLSGPPPAVPLPPKEAVEQPSAILDALALMAAGDSASVFQAVDSMTRQFLPPNRRNTPDIRYELMLLEVVTQAQQAEMNAANLAVLDSVAKKTQALIVDFNTQKIGSKLISLPSGLQMVIHEIGNGKEVVKGENLRVHYYGALNDGKMFDNSFERGEPIEFVQGTGQMIPGFDEGAGMLQHGGKATLFIPYQLGYGEEGTPDGTIPAKALLVFYIEVE